MEPFVGPLDPDTMSNPTRLPSRSESEDKVLEFQVNGMTCGGCARAITNAVESVDAAATVQVDLAAKRVTIDPAADTAKLQSAIEDAGYEVQRRAG
jgi:copper chaperone